MKNEFKNFCDLELKERDDSKGIVTFYYSQFNTKDLNGDIVLPTAFTKTVSERKAKIYHNINHDENKCVGNPVEFGQDDNGAWVRSQLALDQEDGKDAFAKYKAGMIKGHSMEFKTIKKTMDTSRQARLLNEVLLWGVTSMTTIPANYGAELISLKGLADVATEMKRLNDFLRTADISDKCGEEVLAEYKKLQDYFSEKKNILFKDAGIIHCEKCMKVYDRSKEGKCPNCGQYVNKAPATDPIDYSALTAMFVNK
jgi:HK97 family phage prohead protease